MENTKSIFAEVKKDKDKTPSKDKKRNFGAPVRRGRPPHTKSSVSEKSSRRTCDVPESQQCTHIPQLIIEGHHDTSSLEGYVLKNPCLLDWFRGHCAGHHKDLSKQWPAIIDLRWKEGKKTWKAVESAYAAGFSLQDIATLRGEDMSSWPHMPHVVHVLIFIVEDACLTKHGWMRLHDGTDPKTTPPPPSRLFDEAYSHHTARGTSPAGSKANGETLWGESLEDESQVNASQEANTVHANGDPHAGLHLDDSAPPLPVNWTALASEPMELDFAGGAPKNQTSAHGSGRGAKKLHRPPTTPKKTSSEVSQRRGTTEGSLGKTAGHAFSPI